MIITIGFVAAAVKGGVEGITAELLLLWDVQHMVE